MLLRFSVENYASFNERQELSLVTSSLKDNEEGLISWPNASESSNFPQLLAAAVIFGPNAGGKSNFIDAIMFLQFQVLYSQSRGDVETPISRNPFRLAPGNQRESTVFVIEFLVKGVLHEYGCELSDSNVMAEWLYRYPLRRRQILFEREEMVFKFGRSLKGYNQRIAAFTRPNSLFLSAAGQNNHPQLSTVVRFFTNIKGTNSLSPGTANISSSLTVPENIDNRVLQFLRQIDTGIEDIQSQVRQIPEDELELKRKFVSLIMPNADEKLTDFMTSGEEEFMVLEHSGEDGYRAAFDFQEESAGTQRLLLMLPRIFRALDEGSLFILDELEVSVHTLVCELILDLFRSAETNPRGAQIIATTHNIELLKSEILRRDQIWFAEKNAKGATQLVSLAEFNTRKEDNRQKDYLKGRFGAIPFARRAADLGLFLIDEEN